jgi:light-regulated signal transduction histidine kinase (bacteriophytochrome)
MGRVVRGASCPWGEFSWGECLGASLQKIWVKKVERICQVALNLADKFLEEFGFEHQQEEKMESLQATVSKIAELAQLVEGLEMEINEAEVQEIARELQSEKSRTQKIVQPLLGLEERLTAEKLSRLRGISRRPRSEARRDPQALVETGCGPTGLRDPQRGDTSSSHLAAPASGAGGCEDFLFRSRDAVGAKDCGGG